MVCSLCTIVLVTQASPLLTITFPSHKDKEYQNGHGFPVLCMVSCCHVQRIVIWFVKSYLVIQLTSNGNCIVDELKIEKFQKRNRDL